jgi:DNA-binding transcriptional LysR family regulator
MGTSLAELKAISFAARHGSLSKAAGLLNITQPALSRRITEAEQRLGVILFERLPRGVQPTPACLAFLRHAEIALASIDEGVEAARNAGTHEPKKLAIGAIEVLFDDRLLRPCRSFLVGSEGSSIEFRSYSWSKEIGNDLISGQLKIGLCYRKSSETQLDAIWLSDDRMSVVCAASHPLAQQGRVTMEQLEAAQWIGNPAAMDVAFSAFADDMRSGRMQIWKTMPVGTIYARAQLAEAGFGLALIRRASILPNLRAGTLVELETPLTTTMPIFLTLRRGAYLGGTTELLINEIRSAYIE